jgi:hypothetical protein
MFETGGECGTYGGEKRKQSFDGETERKRQPGMPERRRELIAESQRGNV